MSSTNPSPKWKWLDLLARRKRIKDNHERLEAEPVTKLLRQMQNEAVDRWHQMLTVMSEPMFEMDGEAFAEIAGAFNQMKRLRVELDPGLIILMRVLESQLWEAIPDC